VIEKNACIFRRFYNFLHIYFVVVKYEFDRKIVKNVARVNFRMFVICLLCVIEV